MTVFEKIEQQQKDHENTNVFWVGEHLKDICAADPHCAELVSQDLENKSMSIQNLEKKIKAYADEMHKKNKKDSACTPPREAERIIREFYGLPAAAPQLTLIQPEDEKQEEAVPDLFAMDDDFDIFSL